MMNTYEQKQEAKIAKAENFQDRAKATNKAIRKGDDEQLTALGYNERQILELKRPDFAGRVGVADYQLTNNNANIRRMKQRVEQLERNSNRETTEKDEEELQDETRKMTLQIISLSFKEDNKWRLTDGAEPFIADIEDIDFLNKIANDEISFGKNDYLICDVRERQTMTAKGLRKERTIIKVLERKPAARQLRLM